MKQHQAKVYPWQATVWKSLTGRFPQLGHGLLFYGKSGSGKHAFALHFAGCCARKNQKVRAVNASVVSGLNRILIQIMCISLPMTTIKTKC